MLFFKNSIKSKHTQDDVMSPQRCHAGHDSPRRSQVEQQASQSVDPEVHSQRECSPQGPDPPNLPSFPQTESQLFTRSITMTVMSP